MFHEKIKVQGEAEAPPPRVGWTPEAGNGAELLGPPIEPTPHHC